MLIVTLLFGVMAFGGSYAVLNYFATGHGLIYEPTLVTTQQIPVGTAISPTMFKLVKYPTVYRPADAPQNADEVIGRIAFITIPAGVPITTDALSAVGAPQSVAGQLPKGGVGFFLPDSALVEPVPLALINARDYVDVYVAGYTAKSGPTDTTAGTNPILSCVQVIDLVGAGQNVPQNVVNAPGISAASTPGFVLSMSPSGASAVLYYVQSGGKLAMVIDRYDACGH